MKRFANIHPDAICKHCKASKRLHGKHLRCPHGDKVFALRRISLAKAAALGLILGTTAGCNPYAYQPNPYDPYNDPRLAEEALRIYSAPVLQYEQQQQQLFYDYLDRQTEPAYTPGWQ